MNSKKAKSLKRQAEQSTISKPIADTKFLYKLLKKSYKEKKGEI